MIAPLKYQREQSGSCLCGGVTYKVNGLMRGVVNCYCGQCRKTSGHHVAATRASWDAVQLLQQDTLAWYESSPGAHRGFCNRCGSSLFWDNGQNNEVCIMAGTLDPPTELPTVANIHVEDASDYHQIPELSG